ncbi:MAG: ribonuclease H-like domain-containing protein, partial [Clostridiales bacterium]|nr:ribonuclease H-like domain-containing protein [Clostridiales bacterium]
MIPSCEIIVTTYAPGCRYGGFSVREMGELDLKPLAALTDGEVFGAGDLLFLDTETTGLSGGAGTVAFLVGAGFFCDGGFVVKQFFMRDFDEELAVLQGLEAEMKSRGALVTYNGKAFDASLLSGRFIMNGMRFPSGGAHLDLLHVARRIWRGCLENCRLATIEDAILSERREGDIPGFMIPGIYFGYVQDRRRAPIERVLEHNRLDILSMAAVLKRVSGLVRRPPAESPLGGGEELYGLGCLLEALGDAEKAERCFELCAEGERARAPAARRALAKLAAMRKRANDFEGALRCWERMAERSPAAGAYPYIEMAKHYEHRARDPEKAKEYADRALLVASAPRLRMGGQRADGTRADGLRAE